MVQNLAKYQTNLKNVPKTFEILPKWWDYVCYNWSLHAIVELYEVK